MKIYQKANEIVAAVAERNDMFSHAIFDYYSTSPTVRAIIGFEDAAQMQAIAVELQEALDDAHLPYRVEANAYRSHDSEEGYGYEDMRQSQDPWDCKGFYMPDVLNEIMDDAVYSFQNNEYDLREFKDFIYNTDLLNNDTFTNFDKFAGLLDVLKDICEEIGNLDDDQFVAVWKPDGLEYKVYNLYEMSYRDGDSHVCEIGITIECTCDTDKTRNDYEPEEEEEEGEEKNEE